MANTVKVTKKDMFNAIKALPNVTEEIISFCDHEIELLDKKASRPRGETKAQKENKEIKERILAVLTEEPVIFADVMSASGLSQSKCSSLLRQLCEDNLANKTIVKGKSYYSLVVE